jgi:hypothetical protein
MFCKLQFNSELYTIKNDDLSFSKNRTNQKKHSRGGDNLKAHFSE